MSSTADPQYPGNPSLPARGSGQDPLDVPAHPEPLQGGQDRRLPDRLRLHPQDGPAVHAGPPAAGEGQEPGRRRGRRRCWRRWSRRRRPGRSGWPRVESDRLLVRAAESFNARDFDAAIAAAEQVLKVLPGNHNAVEILEKARQKKSAAAPVRGGPTARHRGPGRPPNGGGARRAGQDEGPGCGASGRHAARGPPERPGPSRRLAPPRAPRPASRRTRASPRPNRETPPRPPRAGVWTISRSIRSRSTNRRATPPYVRRPTSASRPFRDRSPARGGSPRGRSFESEPSAPEARSAARPLEHPPSGGGASDALQRGGRRGLGVLRAALHGVLRPPASLPEHRSPHPGARDRGPPEQGRRRRASGQPPAGHRDLVADLPDRHQQLGGGRPDREGPPGDGRGQPQGRRGPQARTREVRSRRLHGRPRGLPAGRSRSTRTTRRRGSYLDRIEQELARPSVGPRPLPARRRRATSSRRRSRRRAEPGPGARRRRPARAKPTPGSPGAPAARSTSAS